MGCSHPFPSIPVDSYGPAQSPQEHTPSGLRGSKTLKGTPRSSRRSKQLDVIWLASAPAEDAAAGFAHRRRVGGRQDGGRKGDEAALADPLADRGDAPAVTALGAVVDREPAALEV